jgi:hypothetical protein
MAEQAAEALSAGRHGFSGQRCELPFLLVSLFSPAGEVCHLKPKLANPWDDTIGSGSPDAFPRKKNPVRE